MDGEVNGVPRTGSAARSSEENAIRRLARAVVIAHGGGGGDAGARSQATSFCQSVKESRDGWRLCARALAATSRSSPVHFSYFCLNVILEAVSKRYDAISPTDRAGLRRLLDGLARQMAAASGAAASAQYPHFLRTKLAVVVAAVLLVDYPKDWPGYFRGVLSRLREGDGHVDWFLRVMEAVDCDIVGFDDRRSRVDVERVNAIKKHMQAACIRPIISALFSIAEKYRSNSTKIALRALRVLKEACAWVSVELVGSPQFVRKIFSYLPDERIGCAAIEVLNQLVLKRCGFAEKLNLILRFKMLDIPRAARDPKGPRVEALATLASSIAVQSMGCCRALAAAAAVDGTSDEMSVRAGLLARESMRVVCKYASHPRFQVCLECATSLDQFVGFVAHACKHKGGGDSHMKPKNVSTGLYRPSPGDAGILALIASTVTSQLGYPDGYDFTQVDDEASAFDRLRYQLGSTLVNLVRKFPRIVIPQLAKRVASNLGDLERAGRRAVEGSLFAFFRMSEGFTGGSREEVDKSGVIPRVMALLVRANLAAQSSRTLPTLYHETVVRYKSTFFAAPSLLPPAIASFADKRGIRHCDPKIRSRACYLLLRLLRGACLRSALAGNVPSLVATLRARIDVRLGVSLDSKSSTHTNPPLKQQDIEYLCESVGILCTSKWAGASCPALFAQSAKSMQTALAAMASAGRVWLSDAEMAGDRAAEVIDLTACLLKPMHSDASRVGPCLGPLMAHVLRVYAKCPKHGGMRDAVIRLIHHMIKCVKGGVVSVARKVLPLLVKSTGNTPASLSPVNQLLLQLIGGPETAAPMQPVLAELFAPYVSRLITAIRSYDRFLSGGSAQAGTGTPQATTDVAYSTQRKERKELCVLFLLFCKGALSAKFSRVLLGSPTAEAALKECIRMVLDVVASHSDIAAVKTSILILGQLVVWETGAGGAAAAAIRALPGEATRVTVARMARLDPTDAAASSCLLAIAKLHQTMAAKFAKQFVGFLLAAMRRAFGPTSEGVVREYARAVASGGGQTEALAARNILRKFLASRAGAPF